VFVLFGFNVGCVFWVLLGDGSCPGVWQQFRCSVQCLGVLVCVEVLVLRFFLPMVEHVLLLSHVYFL